MSKYFEIHHKSSDTLDKVDALDFKAGEVIVAVTAYAIAQSDKPDRSPHRSLRRGRNPEEREVGRVAGACRRVEAVARVARTLLSACWQYPH